MLPKKYKLKSDTEITKVFKNGKTVKNSFLFLRYRSIKDGKTKVAFSIGLKYSKKAVLRNQAKRILRQAMNDFIKKTKPGYDLVFYFDKNFKEKIELKTIKTSMIACLLKAKLLK